MQTIDVKKMLENISYAPQLNLIAKMIKEEKQNNATVYKCRYIINDVNYVILDSDFGKVLISPEYNYLFIKKSGFFQRWGKTSEEDPLYSPVGPEILDLEISVNGCSANCPFCYKSNTDAAPINMTFETFADIFEKIPRSLTQIAFGITGVQTNPDFIEMIKYTREGGVIPNFTLTGMDLTDELADQFAELCGAVAVSAHDHSKDICYNTVKSFTSRGMDQVNIHLMVSQETLDFAYEVLNDRLTDSRLADMHAVVFLGVKPKGRARGKYNALTSDQYKELVDFSLNKGFNFGFDSCSAPKFEKAVKDSEIPEEDKIKMVESSESCESSLFSAYINVYGEYWHCSFAEEEIGIPSVDVIQAEDFIEDVWYSEAVKEFRFKSLETMENGCRKCTVFPEINT